MEPILKEVTEEPSLFFNILPHDWKEDIVPVWGEYHRKAHIYTIGQGDETWGGGIVFETTSPDMLYNRAAAESYFERGYLYLGFIWVKESMRGKQLGSHWLQLLFQKLPEQKYWLTIEDHGLAKFYEKNGFRLDQKLDNHGVEEWVMVKG
jgi:diamine N-acetyltransferase